MAKRAASLGQGAVSPGGASRTASDAARQGPLGLTYSLDSNTVIAISNDRPRAASLRYRSIPASGEQIVVSSIVVMELWYGVAHSQRSEESAQSLRFFLSGPVDIVAFTQQDAEVAGKLRSELVTRGTPIGPYDLLIGAQTYRLGATLVTANRSEFARIVGLAIEDWTRP